MAANSAIQWTEATWNPLAGCSEVSPGCRNCYAAVMAKRLEAMGQDKYADTTNTLENGKVVWTGKITLDEKALSIPLKRKKPTTYFVNSMSDLFHEDVPDEFIIKTFAVMLLAQRHTFQVLTKRDERLLRIVRAPNFGECVYDMAFHLSHMWTCGGLMDSVPETDILPNVWLGVSVEDQKRKGRIDILRKVPAAVRFLSCEPLLEDIGELNLDGIHWVIGGGESGGGARPCNVEWIRSVVRQCKAAGVACFVKQLGSNALASYYDNDLRLFYETERCFEWPSAIGWNYRDGQPPLDSMVKYHTNSKGGDPNEWPDELRVREYPAGKESQ